MQIDEYQYLERRLDLTCSRLSEYLLAETKPLAVDFVSDKCTNPVWPPPAGGWQPMARGTRWGGAWDYGWFRLRGVWPTGWEKFTPVLHLKLGGEGLVYREDGKPVTAVSQLSVFAPQVEKSLVRLDPMTPGAEFTFFVRCGALFRNGLGVAPGEEPHRGPMNYTHYDAVLEVADMAGVDPALASYHRKLQLLAGLLRSPGMGFDNARARRIAGVVRRSLNCYAEDFRNVPAAERILDEILNEKGTEGRLRAIAVGHAHLDIAWLWSLDNGVEKAIRTFAEQLTNLERAPEYVFGASQPFLYEMVKARAPQIFERIKAMVKAGRWELQGGMYVESDSNCVGGEALIRQFLYGKAFYRREFGMETHVVWLPDSFGFSALLPQIAEKSGCFAMVTAKPFWAHCYGQAQCTKFPYSAFAWYGIGGGKLLVNILPECYYNGVLAPENLIGAANLFTENDVLNEFLVPFGIGDGGGGPTEEHIENGRLQHNLPDVPPVEFGRAVDSLTRQRERWDELPRHDGDIYLELHRGTLTTIGGIKKRNRRIENKLTLLETLNALSKQPLPAAELEKLWKVLLVNQFHDILPGSAIPLVYERSFRDLDQLDAKLETLLQEAAAVQLAADAEALTLFNPLSFERTTAVELPDGWQGAQGENVLGSEFRAGKTYAWVKLPALGTAELHRSKVAAEAPHAASGAVLENELLRCEFNAQGELIHMVEKSGNFDWIAAGRAGNELRLYVDRPNMFDAWDVDGEYEKMPAILPEVRILSHEKSRTCDRLTIEYRWEHSTLRQVVELPCGARTVTFRNAIDWHETHRMLRVDFAPGIPFESVACDLGFGFQRRSAVRNSMDERHTFEFAAQKFLMAENGTRRAALLNDCKYGCRAVNGSFGINLLRSPRYPDEITDRGTHEFTYAYCAVDAPDGDKLIREAASAMNRPPAVFAGKRGTWTAPFAVNVPGVTLEALKMAEDGSQTWVIRLVEQLGRSMNGTLDFAAPADWCEADLQERAITPIQKGAVSAALQFKPFEIKTVLVRKTAKQRGEKRP